MVVRGSKFALGGEMALQARRRILAGVDDEFEAAARLDVFAAGSVTRFAPGITVFAQGGEMNAGMGPGGKAPHDGRMTILASLVANFMRAGNDQRHFHGPIPGGTRVDRQNHQAGGQSQYQQAKPAERFHREMAPQGLGCRATR